MAYEWHVRLHVEHPGYFGLAAGVVFCSICCYSHVSEAIVWIRTVRPLSSLSVCAHFVTFLNVFHFIWELAPQCRTIAVRGCRVCRCPCRTYVYLCIYIFMYVCKRSPLTFAVWQHHWLTKILSLSASCLYLSCPSHSLPTLKAPLLLFAVLMA